MTARTQQRPVRSGGVKPILQCFPASVRELCTPEQVLLRVHGIEFDSWLCPSCERLLVREDYPTSRCPGCARPLPRRCLTKRCTGVVEPTSWTSGKGRVNWVEPASHCADCDRASVEVSRRAVWQARVPAQFQGWATTGYERQEWHSPLARWMRGEIRTLPVGYLWGPVGVGKSVAAARLAHNLLVEGVVPDMVWVREWDLLNAHKGQFARGDDADELATDSRAILERARVTPLLVVDELFSRGAEGWLDGRGNPTAGARAIGELFYERFEAATSRGLITVIVSNEQPQWSAVFDSRVESRFDRCSRTFYADGENLRAKAAEAVKRAMEPARRGA